MKKAEKESDLYPIVKKWLRKYHSCFNTAIDTGIETSRIDVIGVTDVGGDLSGEIETIAVEVKKERTQPFVTGSGQALANKVYANRIYLAERRDKPFSLDEIQIASHLGIGLIQIQNRKCKEVLSSPYYKPIEKLNLKLLENLALGKCQICNYFFRIGDDKRKIFSNLARIANASKKQFEKAISDKKGLMFWNDEVNERKRGVGNISIRRKKSKGSFERRYICPDCTSNIFSQFKLKD